MKRLGERTERTRPLLITLNCLSEKQEICKKSKQLKYSSEQYSKIYLKSDRHPAGIQELKRLQQVQKNEKLKPENRGTVIKFDWKKKHLLKDNTIIDIFKPLY